MDELHVASSTGGDLQRDREIDDLQLMLDERPPGLPVLSSVRRWRTQRRRAGSIVVRRGRRVRRRSAMNRRSGSSRAVRADGQCSPRGKAARGDRWCGEERQLFPNARRGLQAGGAFLRRSSRLALNIRSRLVRNSGHKPVTLRGQQLFDWLPAHREQCEAYAASRHGVELVATLILWASIDGAVLGHPQ